MFRALLYVVLIYLGYQFIFNFLIPIYRTTQKVRKGFREMSERMDQSSHQETTFHEKNQTRSEGSHENDKVGEYIDFEDVK